MRTIALVSCGKQKRPQRSKARELYTSYRFKQLLSYARSFDPNATFILSAKHGLLGLDEEVEPYDMTMKDLSPLETQRWAGIVLQRLSQVADLQSDRFVVLASASYTEPLLPHLQHVERPLARMNLLEQSHFFKQRKDP
jgi:hypothetical protein